MTGYQFKDSSSIPWRQSTFATGVEVKDLGTSDGRSMQLVRFAAGASFPFHKHEGPEFIYLLKGEAMEEGQRLQAAWPAWPAWLAADTDDHEFHSATGCEFLTVYSE